MYQINKSIEQVKSGGSTASELTISIMKPLSDERKMMIKKNEELMKYAAKSIRRFKKNTQWRLYGNIASKADYIAGQVILIYIDVIYGMEEAEWKLAIDTYTHGLIYKEMERQIDNR